MASKEVNALREEVAGLRKLLGQIGLGLAEPKTEQERTDHVAHGSPAHAQLIGLIEIEEGVEVPEDLVVMKSPKTEKRYRLEDEIAACAYLPGIDPEKAIKHVLRQKISSFENPPEPPENAPNIWQPIDQYTTLVSAR